MSGLNSFLRSNGQYSFLVDYYFSKKAFPSTDASLNTRSTNRISMILKRDEKIRDKIKTYNQIQFKEKQNEILPLSNKEIAFWVNRNEDMFSERQIYESLRLWFKNVSHDWTFDQLYSGMKPSQITYDLSFDD